MKNKIIILTFILIAIVVCSLNRNSNRVPAPPHSICEITAKVLRVKKTKVIIPDEAPSGGKVIEYYEVTSQILEISTYKEIHEPCDSSYIERAEQDGQILTLEEYNKNPIREGQKIKAKIQFRGDEWFNGYFLFDIQILEDTPKIKK